MERRTRIAGLWALLGLLLVVIASALARPMATAWRCYWLNASGETATAEVVDKFGDSSLVLLIRTGSGKGSACTARTSPEHQAALRNGETLPIVHRPERPGECVLQATLDNSAALLWSISGTLACIALSMLWAGIVAQRRIVGSDPARAV